MSALPLNASPAPAAAVAGPVLPGAWLGLLGGGQLGRFFTIAARQMGYRVMVLDPDPESPAGMLADAHLIAGYTDERAIAELGATCAAVTTEFENVPAKTLASLANVCLVAPSAGAVGIAQDRIAEKAFVAGLGLPLAPYAVIRTEADLDASATVPLLPGILKRSREGYDGRGQVRVASRDELRAAWSELGEVACVLERRLPLDRELSVVLARGRDDSIRSYPVAENRHRSGILDTSVVPAPATDDLAPDALRAALAIARGLDYIGVLAVEFFVNDGRLLVNEIAPRPHNSGHYTLDACATSQFEQQVRALCGLPLGDTALLTPAAMVNLLGDSMLSGRADWNELLALPGSKLHLYGKSEARPGRKMGHLTLLGERAAETALQCSSRLAA